MTARLVNGGTTQPFGWVGSALCFQLGRFI